MYGGDISLDGFEILKEEKKRPKKRQKSIGISYRLYCNRHRNNRSIF